MTLMGDDENKALKKEIKRLKDKLDGTEKTLAEVRKYLTQMVIDVKK